jgi:hypothetical protein
MDPAAGRAKRRGLDPAIRRVIFPMDIAPCRPGAILAGGGEVCNLRSMLRNTPLRTPAFAVGDRVPRREEDDD